MKTFVVDTNVPITANEKADHSGLECVLACVDALEKIHRAGKVVPDDGGLILDEYMRNLSLSGQPGAGDLFMQWLWRHQAVAGRCERVRINPCADDPTNFEEFPTDPGLADLDPNDRKFVAVALTSRTHPTILNATDTDWWHSKEALGQHGVRIDFLCTELMRCSP